MDSTPVSLSSIQDTIRNNGSLMSKNETKPSQNLEPLLLITERTSGTKTQMVYTPLICLIVQGKKQLSVGNSSHHLESGQAILVTHDTPIVSYIIEATENSPYQAIVFPLDIGMMQACLKELSSTSTNWKKEESMQHPSSIGRISCDQGFIDAFERMILICSSGENLFLKEHFRKELYLRILLSDMGHAIQQRLLEHSISGKMAAVIDFIKSEFNKTIAIQELTSICSMSASALHRHFKSVTGLSPIQYQKNLRLIHARQSLALNRSSVASVAFEVGYESPSQFSREYSRKFGFNPKQTPPMFAEVN